MTNVTGPTAARCQAAVTNTVPSFSSSGGTGEVKVTVARECSWSAATSASWIEILSGQPGQGDGTISYRVNANGDPVLRKGMISIAEQQTEVSQQGAACHYTISIPSGMLAASGARAGVDVRTHSACDWTASSDAAWLTLQPASGRGDGTIDVIAAANTGAERPATITIATEHVTLRQQSAPVTPAPAPPPPAPAPTPAPTPSPTPSPTPAPEPPPTTPPPPGSPMPAPPPPEPTPPPPPPPPVTIQASGRIDDVSGSCPSVSFTLKGYSVRTSSATQYARGNCKDLRDGRDIVLTAQVESGARVLATKIEIKK